MIDQIKKDLGIGDKDLAEFFGYKSAHSFRTSHRREKVESGVIEIYKLIKSKEQ